MQISEEKTFVENPFEVLFKMVIPTLIGLFVIVAVVMFISGPPKNSKTPVKTIQGFLIFFFLVEAFIFAIVFLTLSFVKKRTILCGATGCEITGVDLWGNVAAPESFRWTEVGATDLKLVRMGRNNRQLNFSVTANGKELRMLSRTIFNRGDFDELLETVALATPHLDYECVPQTRAGGRRIIDEQRKYCKIARR